MARLGLDTPRLGLTHRPRRPGAALAGTVAAALAAALATALVAGCGGGGGGGDYTTTPPVTNTPPAGGPASGSTSGPVQGTAVTVENNSFTPANLAVAVGGTVTWSWDSCTTDPYGARGGCVSHDVTFDQGGVASPAQSSGTYSRTFATAGTYAYHCSIHGSAMSGQIVVR